MIRAAAIARDLTSAGSGPPRWTGPLSLDTWQDVTGGSASAFTLLALYVPTEGMATEAVLHDVVGGPTVGGYRTFLGYAHGTRAWRLYTGDQVQSSSFFTQPGIENDVALTMSTSRSTLRVNDRSLIDNPQIYLRTDGYAATRVVRVGADLNQTRLTDIRWAALYDRVLTVSEQNDALRWMRRRLGLPSRP